MPKTHDIPSLLSIQACAMTKLKVKSQHELVDYPNAYFPLKSCVEFEENITQTFSIYKEKS